MTRPLNIAMISYYLPSGSKIGVGYQVHALANELVSSGHSVTVFSACGPVEGALYTTRTVPLSGANRTFKFALRLRRVDWSPFDVLHAHGDDYWLWRRRVPAHVRTLHGSCFSEALHIRGARERIRMLLLGCTELLASVVADETVTVSDATRRWMPWIRNTIPNGVALSRFHPGERAAHPTILFVGTYGHRKRGRFLMQVFREEVLPNVPDAELWMVAEDAPAERSVTVLGRVSDDELADLYRRAWVFCLPSTYEGFGIPYVEAMASGCPVVATPNSGVLEVTEGGRFGAISSDRDLGTTLVRLLTREEERSWRASAGLRKAQSYDLSNVTKQYLVIYEKARMQNTL